MPKDTPPSQNESNTPVDPNLNRRHFIASTGGLSLAVLAGCTGQRDSGTNGDDSGGSDTGDGSGSGPNYGGSNGGTGDSDSTGTFRLLISDQPVAIDDFDRLDVTFDSARVFRGGGDEEDEEESDESTTTQTETTTENGETNGSTQTLTQDATTDNGSTETEEGQRGYLTLDLGGATVDLTEVVGDNAINVFEGELPEGRYTKIELRAADVEGVVDGELVSVTIPSDKLQLIKPFEVTAGETLSFIFDINVVKKGQSGEYNLLPVIGKSGVAGEDVEVNEIEPDVASEQSDTANNDTESNEAEPDDNETGKPEDPGGGNNASTVGSSGEGQGNESSSEA